MDTDKIKMHIDKTCYKDKKSAKKDFDIIKVRLQKHTPAIEVTIKELVNEIQQGKTISPAVMSGTTADDFVEQQMFLVDIDNTKKGISLLTIEDAKSICEKKHLPLAFYYYTFSHTEKIPKFRLVFIMDEVITDKVLRDTVIQILIDLFEQADTSCTNADRLFLGTNKEAVICDLNARINLDTVLKIPPKSIMVKKSKFHREDKELEQLINDFDLFNYMKKRNGELSHDNSRYAMFKNCEICGHRDDLVYYRYTNSFCCFGAGRKKGGTIIDYLMATEKITKLEAIKKFKYELCGMIKPSKKLELICMKDIKEQEIKWLWYPYIPFGKITILEGDPGDGKTTFALEVASIITNGGKLPISLTDIESGNIIFQTAEDGLADTIKPKLIKAKADTSKVFVIEDSEDALSLIDERIEEAINKVKAKMLIIDPLQAYLGADTDMYRANEVRPIMHHLSNVAERTECAIILICHMNKEVGNSKGIYRNLGSIDIPAAARSVLLLGRDPNNKYIRAVIPIKSSLAPEANAVTFELNPDTGFEWIGESEITARDLLVESKKDTKRTGAVDEAKEYILELLTDGDILVSEAEEQLLVEGFSKSTIRRAREQLGIKTYSKGFKPKEYYWSKSK